MQQGLQAFPDLLDGQAAGGGRPESEKAGAVMPKIRWITMFTKTPASLVNWDYGKGYAGRPESWKWPGYRHPQT
jgi:hypothetical protein